MSEAPDLAKTKIAQVQFMTLARRLGNDLSPAQVMVAMSMALGALVEHLKNATTTRETIIETIIGAVTVGADEYVQFEASNAKAEGRQQ